MAIDGVEAAEESGPPAPSGGRRPSARTRRRAVVVFAGLLALVLVVLLTRPPAQEPSVEQEQDLAIRTVSDLPYFSPEGDAAVLELDIRAPRQAGRDRPVVVLYPPRRALVGRGRAAVASIAADLASRGAVVMVPEPPGIVFQPGSNVLFGEVLAGLTGDAVCAARYAAMEAEQYGGDPDSLVLVGMDEGALAAAAVAFRSLDAGPDCVAPEATVEPRHIVLHQGFWALDPGFDLSLRASQGAYDELAIWSALDGAPPRDVTLLLDSTNRDPRRIDPALREPPPVVAAAVRHHRIYDDSMVTVRESNQVLLEALNAAGHDVHLVEYPGDWRRYGDATTEAVASAVYQGLS